MSATRRALLCIAFGLAVLVAGCSDDVSIEAIEPASTSVTEPPPVEPTRAPASTNSVSAGDVDTAADDGVAADPASAAAPVRSRGQQSTSEQDKQYASIRDVDFRNGFVYDSSFGDGSTTATVTDSFFENGAFGDDNYYSFTVGAVEFGDLDADGNEDAIVATSWNGGGSGHFDSVRAFRLVDGVVQPAGVVPFGDRADGGVFDVRIDGGAAQVWSFSTTLGACCPSEIRRNTLVLGDLWLTRADSTPPRAWLSIDRNDPERELTFLPGTSSAMVVVYEWTTEGSFLFDAAQGQRLSLVLTDGPAPANISVTSRATGEVLSGLVDMTLPADGLYDVMVTFDPERSERTTLDVVIDDGEPVAPISWTPTSEQQLVTEQPYVTTALVWPVFTSDQPGTAAANAALETLVRGLDDPWIKDVLDFPPQGDSTYDLRYDVTLATRNLAAVRFDYYDYRAGPYPNYGPISAVVDLQAGRIIAVEEILDMTRIDDINRLWIAGLEQQGLLAENAAQLLAQQPQFDALTLHADGVEFGTRRNGLGGGTSGTSTIVSYAALGDLVNPDLLARLAIG